LILSIHDVNLLKGTPEKASLSLLPPCDEDHRKEPAGFEQPAL